MDLDEIIIDFNQNHKPDFSPTKIKKKLIII